MHGQLLWASRQTAVKSAAPTRRGLGAPLLCVVLEVGEVDVDGARRVTLLVTVLCTLALEKNPMLLRRAEEGKKRAAGGRRRAEGQEAKCCEGSLLTLAMHRDLCVVTPLSHVSRAEPLSLLRGCERRTVAKAIEGRPEQGGEDVRGSRTVQEGMDPCCSGSCRE